MIPFLDLASDFAEVEGDARRRIDGVLARQQFVLGPETAGLEEALRLRLGAKAAIAVSSGTEALSLALLALGIGVGDAVLLPAFTFFASAGAVFRAGAVPVFCDIDRASFLGGAAQMRATIERDFHVDSSERGREERLLRHRRSGTRLAALMPVHLYGRACEMDDIVALARETGAKVIEDAAQAIDCRIGGKAVGCFGDAGCFSFYPTKNLGGAGDGGLVTCEDEELGQRMARLRTHGTQHGSYEHVEAGINARMSELVAAVLAAKLQRLDAWNARRRAVAAIYGESLAAAAARGLLELPSGGGPVERRTAGGPVEVPASGHAGSHVWHQYVVRIAGPERRDRVKDRLEAAGIATRVFYPLPLHLQPCFVGLGGKTGDLPESEAAAREVLSLPIHASLEDDVAREVADALAEAAAAA